jgi:hypothetical protein
MCRSRVAYVAAVLIAPLVTSCAAVPKAELTAYTAAYADVQTVTNGVLDIVSPYERVVIRFAARSTGRVSAEPASDRIRLAQAGAIDPSLLANPPATRPAPAPDPSLLADPSARPVRPAPAVDPSLLANPSGARPTPAVDPSLLEPRTRPSGRSAVVVERACRNGFGGVDPFCYETRDGFADIGDPPLVAAYRNLATVVLRFNTLLLAYADGIDGRLIQQEFDGLTSSINDLTRLAPITNISGAGAFASRFTGLVSALAPIANLAGRYIDRERLRAFLLDNYDLVDEAIGLMARNSVTLYSNVAVGTQLYQINVRGAAQSLNTRRREIRRLIANWTVLLDDTRRILRDLKVAVEASDGLETRIRNLEGTVTTRIDTNAIKKQIATLGTPVMPP